MVSIGRWWTATERHISQRASGPHSTSGVAGCTCVSASNIGLSNTRTLSYERGTRVPPPAPGTLARRPGLDECRRSLAQPLAQDPGQVPEQLRSGERKALPQPLHRGEVQPEQLDRLLGDDVSASHAVREQRHFAEHGSHLEDRERPLDTIGPAVEHAHASRDHHVHPDRKSTRLNSSHGYISYAVFCLKKKN